MTDDEVNLRAFLAGMLTSKMRHVEDIKVTRARIEHADEPPEIDVEIDGCVITIAVLSAKRVQGPDATDAQRERLD